MIPLLGAGQRERQESGQWAEAWAQDQSTWTLRNPHGKANTALSHLLQSLGPPIHDGDTVLTVQFHLVQVVTGPTAHYTSSGGLGEDTVRRRMAMQ